MGDGDVTTRILTEIRDEVRAMRADHAAFREQIDARFARVDERFEVIETALRDLAQQLVILGRGVKEAIEERGRTRERLDDHERRLGALEEQIAR